MAPAAAIEFQHYKDTIIEKINSFFGYKAISDLRLQQNFIPKKNLQIINNYNEENISKDEEEMIKSEMETINDKELEKSIVNLGASIKGKDK